MAHVRYTPQPGRAHRRGLTLVELMIAMTITSIIAAAVAAMIHTTAYGISSQDQLRTLMVAHELAEVRISPALRGSTMVLAEGDDYVVLWTYDRRDVDSPNLSELHRIEIDRDENELRSYKAPAGLAEAQDTRYDLVATDFGSVTAGLRDTAEFPRELWAGDVTDLAFSFNTDDPRNSTFIGYRIEITVDGQTETAVGGTAPRN